MRNKPNNLYPVKNLEHANEVLAEIGSIKRQIAATESKMNDEIDSIIADKEAAIAPLVSRLRSLENGLIAFAEYNKDDLFSKSRSKELVHGSLGYRRSSEIKTLPKMTWKQVLGNLEEMGFLEAVRTRKDPDKEILRTWSAEKLQLIGCKIQDKDTFWYEVNEVELQS